jgi:hypothetical protein
VTVSKTALGAQVMKDRSVSLSAQQRSALILCDGKRSAEEVVRMTAAVGVTLVDLEKLETLGLVEIAATATATAAMATTAPVVAAAEAVPPSSAEGVGFQAALNAAITLCSNIGFKGFSLNMALTGTDSIEKLQKIAPEIRRAAGDAKYKPLHALIFGQPL